jgi:hypothetical protein
MVLLELTMNIIAYGLIIVGIVSAASGAFLLMTQGKVPDTEALASAPAAKVAEDFKDL